MAHYAVGQCPTNSPNECPFFYVPLVLTFENFVISRTGRLLVLGISVLWFILDIAGLVGLSISPDFGAKLRHHNGKVIAKEVQWDGALAQAGIHSGDTILALNGSIVEPLDFVPDPNILMSWYHYDHFYATQKHLYEHTQKQGELQIQFLNHGQVTLATVPVHPLGLWRAVQRSFPFHIFALIVLIAPWFIWRVRKDESTFAYLLSGLVMGGVFAGLGPRLERSFVLDPLTLNWSTTAIMIVLHCCCMSVHGGLAFPTLTSYLQRNPWIRWLAIPLILIHFSLIQLRILSSPFYSIQLIPAAGIFSLVALIAGRYWIEKVTNVRRQLLWGVLGTILGFSPWLLFNVLPMCFGMEGIPLKWVLMPMVFLPIGFSFSILRYRLLEIDHLLDWMSIHAITVLLVLLAEMILWFTLLRVIPEPNPTITSMIQGLIIFSAYFLYAPIRSYTTSSLSRWFRRTRPETHEAVQHLLQQDLSHQENPQQSLEQALIWTFHCTQVIWITSNHPHSKLLLDFHKFHNGRMGYDITEASIPKEWADCAFFGLRKGHEELIAVLFAPKQRGWIHADLSQCYILFRTTERLIHNTSIRASIMQTKSKLRDKRDKLLRDIHDGMGSQLFGISLLAQIPKNSSTHDMTERLRTISNVSQQAMETLKTGLTIMECQSAPLHPALQRIFLGMKPIFAAKSLDFQFHIEDTITPLHVDTLHLNHTVQSVQECLSNAVRHSFASKVQATVKKEFQTLQISISDDGKGFLMQNTPKGHGLHNIHHRIHSIGGEVSFTSQPGFGTQIHLKIPL